MLRKTIKDLSGHTLIYSLSWFASSAAGILLLPVYTRFLSKTDYGILEVLDYTNMILMLLVITGLNAAIPRFFNDTDDEEEKKRVVSTATIFVLLFGLLVCFLAYAVNDSLALIILGKSSYKNLINLNILLLYAQLIVQISGVGFIAAKKSKAYLAYMLTRLILSIIANLYFIVVLKLGVLGMLYGNITSNTLVALVITGHNIVRHGLRLHVSMLRKLLKFGIPLIPASFLGLIMHNADRFLIRHYCSLSDVGLYSIGYKFPFMLNALILQSFNFIWAGATMYEISKQPDSAYQYGRIATYVIAFFLFAQLSLSLFSVSIVRILVDKKFFEARQIIPLVSMGVCFHAFYFFFSIGSFLQKKTWRVNLAYLPAAIINIIGNMILLPKYGYMAAAWTSIVTYFTFSFILYFSCKRLVHIRYETKRIVMLFAIGIATFLFSSLFIFENLLLEILKSMGFVLLFLGLIGLFGWFTKGEKEILREKFRIIITRSQYLMMRIKKA